MHPAIPCATTIVLTGARPYAPDGDQASSAQRKLLKPRLDTQSAYTRSQTRPTATTTRRLLAAHSESVAARPRMPASARMQDSPIGRVLLLHAYGGHARVIASPCDRTAIDGVGSRLTYLRYINTIGM